MNIPELKKLAEQYRNDPSIIFAMPNYMQIMSCGTAFCIAGQAAINNGYDVRFTKGVDDYAMAFTGAGEQLDIWCMAQELLGLTDSQCGRLFVKRCWPDRFKHQPDTPALAAERIEHFIQTEGRE